MRRERTSDAVEHGLIEWVHRGSSGLLGAGLCVFGALGFASRLSFFATSGAPVLGLSSNGLLSTISVVVGAILIAAAVRGGRVASTTSVVVGALFLASGVLNVLVLATPYNVLSFRMPNVVFSLVAGGLLLVLGAYGRFTGRLREDSPYRRAGEGGPVDAEYGHESDQQLPADPAEVAAAREMAETERVVAAGGGTAEQRRRLDAVDARREPGGRRATWSQGNG
jgi:hypothetical protein